MNILGRLTASTISSLQREAFWFWGEIPIFPNSLTRQFLVENNYAAVGKVAINGASNGGLLVAACMLRAPAGLLGAAVAEVGVLDLLRFANFTIGKAWTSDFGDPDDPHDFDFIHPIYNIFALRLLTVYFFR
jgi:protease II